jgi:hypothetical protein
MTDPVDTDALRAVAAEMDNDDWTDWSSTEAHVNGEKVAAAADEVDRLRDRAVDDAKDREQLRVDFNARSAEASRLRAVIENAPHDSGCDMRLSEAIRIPEDKCTCWKRYVL